MEGMRGEVDGTHLLVGYLEAFLIGMIIERGADDEPGVGLGSGDQRNDDPGLRRGRL
jgi:hypothetical protein